MNNPLLSNAEALDFAAIRPEHITSAFDLLLAQAEAALTNAGSADVAVDYHALSLALDVPVERLGRAWSAVNHLQEVINTPALRSAHAALLPRVTSFYTRLGADERLYAKYKTLAGGAGAAQLNLAQQKALSNTLRDFVLGGAELVGAARERHAQIQDRCAELSRQFGEHVLDATDNFSHYVTVDSLQGVPADVVAAAREAAQAEGRSDFKLTLQEPCYRPVMQFADNRELRYTMHRAYCQRASDLGPPELDNTALMQEHIALRHEEARLLGHGHYAALSLVTKMAQDADQVLKFVRDLATRARPFAEKDAAELQAYALSPLGLDVLQAWDRSFTSEKLRESRYAFSGQEVKKYFTEARVLQGLFDLIETLFDVTITAASASRWHDDVVYLELRRAGLAVGALYLDLHARAGKQSGAWMDEARQRWRRPDTGQLQLPVAHIVCNFAAPLAGQSVLLSHDDVTTLFHEFGHALHHLLTQVDEAGVSGIAGVEWDAAELPSQFMENFCWEWEVVKGLTCHVDTGEALPRELFDRMLAARNFQSGFDMVRRCEYALLDMRLHTELDADARIDAITDEVRAEVAVVNAPPYLRFAHSFTHIFDGGYAAGFYGYAWAEVLSADAFAAFEEEGVLDRAVGKRYRENILETGGSRSALDNFVAFRGRAPQADALFRHQGMA